jgi:hypothetical protein
LIIISDKLTEHNCQLDELAFHYHPVSYSREAHRASNNLSFTNEHHKILSYRVIEYNWFPSSFRPGLHSERPDLNWFLEMWIPFDYGNQAIDPQSDDKKQFQRDLGFGRWETGEERLMSGKFTNLAYTIIKNREK